MIQPLAWEFPYAGGMAQKKKKGQKKKKKDDYRVFSMSSRKGLLQLPSTEMKKAARRALWGDEGI